MAYEDMTRRERLARVGGFIAETTQFSRAKSTLARTYGDWHCGNEGTCSFILGETGAGKTTVADDFIDELRTQMDASASDAEAEAIAEVGPLMPNTWGIVKIGENGFVRPVVKVFVGPRARFNALLNDTLLALGIRAPVRANFGLLMTLLMTHLREQQVRMLIFDEVHHIVEGHGKATAYEAADVFKMLLIQARVQIVCIGLPHAETILDANGQLERRCGENCLIEPLAFDAEDEDGELRSFLQALESELPFDQASDIASETIATRIHLATGGYVGQIVKLVHVACAIAIDDGLDRVKGKLLERSYARIMRVGEKENPFAMAVCDAEAIAKIRARIAKRRAAVRGSSAETSKSRKGVPPDFRIGP